MKICMATAARSEYGLLKPLMEKIKADPSFILQIMVTGAHLSPEFGLTYRQIEDDGYAIDEKIEMLLSSDTPQGIIKSMGLGMIGFADALERLRPDLIVILGDRYEMLSLASAALIFRIPIMHISGGDITEGAYDDTIRHAITKMSVLHFTSTESARRRVIQMGEHPEKVFNVGAIGLDNFKSFKLLTKEQLERDLHIRFGRYNYLVGFHPETLSFQTAEKQFEELLNAIDEQEDSFFIFTKANADTNGRVINRMMEEYMKGNPQKVSVHTSLGSLCYLSVMKIVTAVVGNSSSGIVEAPSVPTATINIGHRQKGRILADSIINCSADKDEILKAFETVKSRHFQQKVARTVTPYGNGSASDSILEILKTVSLESLRIKTFYNLPQ